MTPEELKATYNPEGSPLRRAQLRMLEMLKFIDQVCKEHGINYWLDSGTLLGAARHQGFIPWDDDTDICMPYEDMLKFKQVMLHHNPSHEFILQCQETDKNIYAGWVILRDLKSEGISDDKLHNLYQYRGLNVDIFPVTAESVGILQSISNLYYKLLIKAPLKEKRGFKYIRLFSPLLYQFFYHAVLPIFRYVSHFLGKRPYYRMIYGCEFTSKRYLEDVWPLTQMKFEGVMLSVPGNTDSYLTKMYGDWREIPDVDHIKTHDYEVKFLD